MQICVHPSLVAVARQGPATASYFLRRTLRVIGSAWLLAGRIRLAFLKLPLCRFRNRRFGGRIRNINASISCIIAALLIVYQLKRSQRCLRLLCLEESLIRDLIFPFPTYIGIDPSKRMYTPLPPFGILSMFSLALAHIVPYRLTIRMNSPSYDPSKAF